MNDIDASVFLMVNASAASPTWVLPLARMASLELPKALLAGMVGAALFMDRRQRHDLLAVLLSMLAAWIAARLIQYAFPVQRPFALGIGTAWLARAPTSGFPSTHGSVAFAFALAIGMRSGWTPLSGVALVLGALVAWSRVSLGLHFPSDALAGAVVGGLSAWICCRRPEWRILPWRRAEPVPHSNAPLV
jgi:undecaprenyl-diphosphatase